MTDITPEQHLADAKLHLQRALLAIRAAAQTEPHLVVQLGSRYAALRAEAEELERVRVLLADDPRGAGAAAGEGSFTAPRALGSRCAP